MNLKPEGYDEEEEEKYEEDQ